MKKFLSLLLTFVVALGALTGCGSSANETKRLIKALSKRHRVWAPAHLPLYGRCFLQRQGHHCW